MEHKFAKIKKEVISIIKNSELEEDAGHALNTLKWVKKMNPKASEELKIAALAHDIERAVSPRTKKRIQETTQKYKERHAARSAKITVKLLNKFNFSKRKILRIKKLIQEHEGRSADKDLRDADLISFFDHNLKFYYKRKGFEKTKERIRYNLKSASKRVIGKVKKVESFPWE